MNYLESEAALTRFVEAFENGTYPGKDWKHPEHLALAASYLFEMPLAKATVRARSRIQAYNEAQGGKNTDDAGYHETLTVFWLTLIDGSLDRTGERLNAVRRIVERYGPRRDLYREYYDFDLLKSRDARCFWVPPQSWEGGVGAMDSIASDRPEDGP